MVARMSKVMMMKSQRTAGGEEKKMGDYIINNKSEK